LQTFYKGLTEQTRSFVDCWWWYNEQNP
jgi:hypothetical protein